MGDPVKLDAFLSGEFDRLDVHARGRLSLAEIEPALLRLAEIQGLIPPSLLGQPHGGRGGGSGGGGAGRGERQRGGSRGGSGGRGSWGSSGDCGGGRSGAGEGGREVLPGKGKNDEDLAKGLFVSFMSADLSSEIGRHKFVSVCRDVILASQDAVEEQQRAEGAVSGRGREDPLPRLLEGSTALRELFNDADEVDEFIDALWTRMDLDGDGTVTMHEIRPMLPALGLFPQPLPISTEQEDEILTELLQTYAGWGGAEGENGAEEGGVEEGESDSAGGALEAFGNGSRGLEGSSSNGGDDGGGGGGGGAGEGAVDFSMGLSKVQFMWLVADILFTVAQGLEDDPLYLPANMTILNRPFLLKILSDEAFFHRLTDRMFLTWDETDRGMLSRSEEADSIYLSLFLTADCDTSGFVDREEFQSLMHSIFLGAALQLQATRLPPQPLPSPLAPVGAGPSGTSSSFSSLSFFRPFSLSLPSIPFSAALPWGDCADSSTTAFHSRGSSSSSRGTGADPAAAATVADLPTLTGFKLFDGRRVRKMVRADGGACLDVWLNSAFEELVTSTSDSGDGAGRGEWKHVRVSGSRSGEAEGIDVEGLSLDSPGGGRTDGQISEGGKGEKGESGAGVRGEREREEGFSEGRRNGGGKKVSWGDALGNGLEASDADKEDVSRPTDRPVVTWAALERKLVQQLQTLGMPGEGVSEDWERMVHDMVARERMKSGEEEMGGRGGEAEGEEKGGGDGEEEEEGGEEEEERRREAVWLDREEFVAVMARLLKQVGQTLQDTPLLLRSLDGTLIRAFLQHPSRLSAAIRSTFQALDNKGWGGMPAARLVPALRVIGLSAGLPCRGGEWSVD
ncbi:unnamed protein product [Closterium sp. NIES-64]|nr:unnamed protein product [Closterium sp. NIES-64]